MAAFMSYGAVIAELAPLIALTFALLIVMGVAMWLAERPMRPRNHESAVDTLRDGVYWAVVTMTTVGYGDVYPITNTGRVIAVLPMIGGISLVGVVTAALASWIIQRVAEEETASQVATAAHIDELRSEIRELAQELRGRQ